MFFKHFFKSVKSAARVYLDYASSTPVDYKMLETFPVLPPHILAANPSALHHAGVHARRAIESVRDVIAQAIDAHTDEITFTSGATESNNMALMGFVTACQEKGLQMSEIAVFVSEYEHASILECAAALAKRGVQVTKLTSVPVLDPKDISVPPHIKAVLVSVMYVNNEVGTILPIKDIAKRVRKLRKEYPDVTIVLHTDATQAPLYIDLGVPQLGIDMMTLGATKLYCPKGVGMLYVRRGITIAPLMYGGGQEKGKRPGTEALSLVHAFAHALAYAQSHVDDAYEVIAGLQEYFEELVQETFPGVGITLQEYDRAPHISHVAIKGFDSELLVIELDARGIAVSSKSACKNEEGNESAIVESIYGPNVGAVRFSFGRMTTRKDIDRAVNALQSVIRKYYVSE